MLSLFEEHKPHTREEHHEKQLQLATVICTWQEDKIQQLKDQVRILNQEVLLKKLQIKHLKEHDKSKENQKN